MIIVTDENYDGYERYVDMIIDANRHHTKVDITLTRDEAFELREQLNEVLSHT